jgi:phage terminase large subunit-like protein
VSKLDDAKRWLEGLLADGPVAAPDVLRLAGSKGISERTLRRAAADLDVRKWKVGAPTEDGQTWAWSLDTFGVDGGEHDDAFHLLSSLRLEDGREWGEAAEPFQVADAAAILSDTGPRLHFLTRPRGSSKTSDLAGVAIALLLEVLPNRGRGFCFGADQDQAALLLDAIAGFASRTEGLAGALKIENWRVTANHNGAQLRVMAADAASAWGLKGDLFVVDEFAQWPTTPGPRRLWDAILSAVPKVAGCRLVLLSTSGDPSHPSYKLLNQAKTSDQWRVAETPGPCPWISERALEEQRRLLPGSQYRRLHLNQWVEAEDRLVDAEALRDAVRLDGPLEPRSGERYVIGLDVGLKHDRTVAAVCHAERIEGDRDRARLVVLDRMLVFSGTRLRPVRLDDVERAVLDASKRYNRAPLRLDPWQSVGLGQRLSRQGIRVTEYPFSAQSVGRLASMLHMLLKDRRLWLPDDEELLDELANVRLKETSPGVLRMDHDPDKHDDRAIALALAAFPLVEREPSGRAGCGNLSLPPTPIRSPDHHIVDYDPLVGDSFARAEEQLRRERSGW